jgi:hypothetical protein
MADLTKIGNIKDVNSNINISLEYLKMCNKNPFENITWKYVSTQEVKKVTGSLKTQIPQDMMR